MDMKVNAELKDKPEITASKPLFKLDSNGDLLFKLSLVEDIKVAPTLCFPWMRNDEFISIRDEQGVEVFLISTLSELDEPSRSAVTESLLEVTFMMRIVSIIDIKSEFEIRSWTVETEQGSYKFQTQIDYWPQVLNKNLVIIRDVAGNIFYIEETDGMDDNSKQLLWPYLD